MVRFHLPPNLIAAAGRDAVALRVEVDLARPSPNEIMPVLALLQRWSGSASPPKFIQLSRAQLRDLAIAADDQPIFVENGQVTTWRHPELVTETPKVDSDLRTPSNANRTAEDAKKDAARRSAPTVRSGMTVDGSEHFLAITLPSREHPRYAEAVGLMQEHGFVLEPSNRKWWQRDRHKTLNFLARHRTSLERVFGAEFTPNFEKNTAHLRPVDIVTEIAPQGDAFAVSIGLRAGDADDGSIRTAVATNRAYLESKGKIFLLDPARLADLETAQRALAGDPTAGAGPRRTHQVPAARAAEAQEILEELSPNFQPPETWRTRSTALRQLSSLPAAPVPPALDGQLRPYQRLGAAWLWYLFRQELGGILADEMGLGKTLQALALLSAAQVGGRGDELRVESSELRDRRAVVAGTDAYPHAQHSVPATRQRAMPSALTSQPSTPTSRLSPLTSQPSALTSLVVAPASLLENWRREALRFAPQLRTFVHHGEQRLASATDFSAHDVVITSYGTLTRDQGLFSTIEFCCVIADEAQHIKNRRSQNAAALRALRARARFLLTGTPLENSLDDLRSLFEFLLPGYLTRLPSGVRGEDRTWYDERLRAQSAHYILRRTKQAVAPELPAKLEQVVWCELAPKQARLYRDMQEKSERELFDLEAGGASEGKLKFAALTQLLRLRQICCDPRLVATTPEVAPDAENSPYPDSAKLDAFRELLAEAVDDGHRVLVFSQFTSLLALLRTDLEAQQLAYCYLDGSMSARARQAAVDSFQASPDIPIFLLSLKAGGTGLNLTGADTVVHFDPWWNPAAEAQATDRAHRIGQTRVVTSYKLIASGTVEEKVLGLQAEKRALLAGVFEASDSVSAKLSLADMKSLLAS